MSEETHGRAGTADAGPDPLGRRRDVRVATRLAVRYRLEGVEEFVERYSANISYNGIFLVTREPKPLGTEVFFEVQLGDGQPALSGYGVVRWCRPDTGNAAQPPGLGLQFTRLDAANRARVRAIVDRYLEAKAAGLEPQAPSAEELIESSTPPPLAPLPWRIDETPPPSPQRPEDTPGVAAPRPRPAPPPRVMPLVLGIAFAATLLVIAWLWRGALAP